MDALPVTTTEQMSDISELHIDSISVSAIAVRRPKLQREFKALMRLRMAVLLSVFKRSDDELLDDPRVETRLNELLDTVRERTPSLSFHDKYTRRASELAPGIFLKVNFACTEGVLYREQSDNVVYLEVPRG